MNNSNKLIIIFALLSILFSTCVKENFDTVPEKKYSVNFDANSTIADLKAIYQGGNTLIDENIIIKGIVTANDETGNFYKEIYLQDTTGAINIRINQKKLHIDYPVGQLLYVKCSGLYLGTYKEMFQLGYGNEVSGIEKVFVDKFLFKSDGGSPVEAKVREINELKDSELGMLIKVEGLQFEDPAQTYADGINHSNKTTILENCSGKKLDLRSSGYADFANDSLPKGNGSVTAILSKWSDYQLKIRNTDEVQLNGERCNQ